MISWRQQIRLDFVLYIIRVHSNHGNSYEGSLTRVGLQCNNDNNNNNNYIIIITIIIVMSIKLALKFLLQGL